MHPVRLAALASALSLSCSTPSTPPGPPPPVYEWEREGQTSYWRFVPLSARTGQHPSDDDFARAQRSCQGPELRSCLTGLGFYQAECSDGLDNDADSMIDHPADPGCAGPHALEEAPACSDGLDNDGDGLADWDGAGFSHPDPECEAEPSRDREQPERRRRFGLPF